MPASVPEPARPVTAPGAEPPPRAPSPVTTDASGDEWPADAADAIERLVLSVRSKTIGPLEKVARALVYGVVALIVGTSAAVLGSVALVRFLDVVIPGTVWSAHAVTGGIFCLAGLFLWRKRSVKTVKV